MGVRARFGVGVGVGVRLEHMRPTWLVGWSASEACPATCSVATARFTWLGLG